MKKKIYTHTKHLYDDFIRETYHIKYMSLFIIIAFYCEFSCTLGLSFL